jgi:hypothetical protein
MKVRVLAFLLALAAHGQSPSREGVQFFESKIRPLLIKNCVVCHSEAKPTSGLSLESREAILNGGNRGHAVDLGSPESSLLLQAVEQAGALKMPPGAKLPETQRADFRRWVEMGLPWTEATAAKPVVRKGADHWAFKKPQATEPPQDPSGWSRTSVDRFLLARMKEAGLAPSPEAPKSTLIRRVHLDLTGLPPTPADVDDFLKDTRPDAYEKLVEKLLASPHYGERWGRHWLDAARYADTNGFGFDNPRVMWRWRDWVIQALNRDMPFDQFVTEQLAGDMLPNASLDQKIATGFHRNTMINEEGGVDQEQYRVEAVFDRVATTGTVFLGLTLGCSQCHDHKYDPVSQREFYQLFAFFNQQEEPVINVVTPADVDRFRRVSSTYAVERLRLQAAVAERRAELVGEMAVWESKLTPSERKKLPGNVQAVLAVPAGQRTLEQVRQVEVYFFDLDNELTERERKLTLLSNTPNDKNPNQFTAMVLAEREKPRASNVLIGGDFLKKGIAVKPAVPAFLPLLTPANGTPTRLDLALWLTSPEHPLTARVTVNRIWQQYFGKGIVRSSEDFGTQGDKPTHPELLDFLALEFQRLKWSQKALHRMIVTSAAYRQSSHVTADHQQKDPDNVWLARFPRVRVEAEVVRDIALAVSGLLNPQVGGPSVFAPQPAKVTDLSRGNLIWVNASGPDRYRRGIYTFWKRTSPYPAFTTFDAPTADATNVRRTRSNTPLQALTTLNEELFVEAAEALASRVLKEAPPADLARLDYAYRLVLARQPDGVERDSLLSLLATEKKHGASEKKAWFAISRTLINLDEAITRE